MPTLALPKIRPLIAWSFSRYNDYKKCPAFFCYKHLMGMKEPGNAAMNRGSDIHTLAERYTTKTLPKLPAELGNFKEEFKDLRAQKVKYVEESWTWTANWAGETSPTDWANAWLRVKIDCAYVNVPHNALVVIDHKTGKFNDYKLAEYLDQLEFYGLAGLIKFPDVRVVSPRLWYLDAGIIYPDGSEKQPELEYFRADEPKLRKLWLKKIEPMFRDKTFKPTPNHDCTYCHYRKSNNGPCKY